MRGVYWQANAWDSYIEMQTQRPFIKKVHVLIKEIQRNDVKCSYGKPEKLKGRLEGCTSVKVNKKNRLIFKIDDEKVTIFVCGGHYGDH